MVPYFIRKDEFEPIKEEMVDKVSDSERSVMFHTILPDHALYLPGASEQVLLHRSEGF